MAYSKDEMSLWIKKHFDNLAHPFEVKLTEINKRPLPDDVKGDVIEHLNDIVDAQNTLISVLRKNDFDIGVFGVHSLRRYLEYNNTWQDMDWYNDESFVKIKENGVNNYINEKLSYFNKKIFKDEIYEIDQKLAMIRNEKNRLLNWVEGIGYNSKMSEGNKLKAYNLLVDAGVDPDLMERKFKYELTLTGIASDVTRGEFGKIETKAEKVARERALVEEQQN